MRSRVQINLLSKDYAVLRTLREAVVSALRFQRGTVAGCVVHAITHEGDGPTSFDHELAVFHRYVDFHVFHEVL